MAEIPRYTQQIGGLGGANIPKHSVDVPADAFGGGQGKQLAQLGQSMQQTAGILDKIEQAKERMKQEKYAANLAKAKTSILGSMHEYLSHEDSPKWWKGEKAEGMHKAIGAHLDELTAEVRANLAKDGADDATLEAFDNYAVANYVQTIDPIVARERSEVSKGQVQAQQDLITATTNKLQSGDFTPEQIKEIIETEVRDAVNTAGDLTGMTTDARQNAINAIYADMAVSKISGAIFSGNIPQADNFLEAFKDTLPSETYAKLKGQRDDEDIYLKAKPQGQELAMQGVSYGDAMEQIAASAKGYKNPKAAKKYTDDAKAAYNAATKDIKDVNDKKMAALVESVTQQIESARSYEEAYEYYRKLPEDVQKLVVPALMRKSSGDHEVRYGSVEEYGAMRKRIMDARGGIGEMPTIAEVQTYLAKFGKKGTKLLTDLIEQGETSEAGAIEWAYRDVTEAYGKLDMDEYTKVEEIAARRIAAERAGEDPTRIRAIVSEILYTKEWDNYNQSTKPIAVYWNSLSQKDRDEGVRIFGTIKKAKEEMWKMYGEMQ